MRQTNINSIWIDYPDEIVFTMDTMPLKVSGINNIGAMVTLTEPTGNSVMFEYYSDQNELFFYLDDAVRALYSDNLSNWMLNVKVFDAGIPIGETTLTFKVYSGKSFTTRSHGIASTIYIYNIDELVKLGVYSPETGVGSVGLGSWNIYKGHNSLNLTSQIQQNGTYNLCIRDSNTVPPIAFVTGDTPMTPSEHIINIGWIPNQPMTMIDGGDVFVGEKQIFPVCHKIIFEEHCNGWPFIELAYIDLDGNRRYLGGKAVEVTDDVKSSDWRETTLSHYKSIPMKYMTEHEKSIKAHFFDIEADAYPMDIIYSPNIWIRDYNSEWKECTLKTSKLTRNGDETLDFDLEITVSK